MYSDFPVSLPEIQGLSSAALWRMLDNLEELEVTSMQLVVNGYLVVHFCRKPYEADGLQLALS